MLQTMIYNVEGFSYFGGHGIYSYILLKNVDFISVYGHYVQNSVLF